MSLRKRVLHKLATVAAAVSLAASPAQIIPAKESSVLTKEQKDWAVYETLQDPIITNDLSNPQPHHPKEVRMGLEETMGTMLELLFPEIPGTRLLTFMPTFGKNKIHNPDIELKERESDHFRFFNYNPDNFLTPHTLEVLETEFKKDHQFFNEARFDEKFHFFLYNTARDYKQSNIMSLSTAEGSVGITTWPLNLKMAVRFEGEESRLDEVIKHELFHAYTFHVGDFGNLPLWWIEGSAKYWGEGDWSVTTQQVARDLYLNHPNWTTDQIDNSGSPILTYHYGSFITQVIAQEFGKDKIAEIYKNSKDHSFGNNIKHTLGISIEELYNRVDHVLEEKYGHLHRRRDIDDIAIKLEKSKKLLAADSDEKGNGNFLTLSYSDGSVRLRLHHLSLEGKLTDEIVADSTFGNKELQGTADIKDNLLAYIVDNNTDELRIQSFKVDHKIRPGDVEKYTFEKVQRISHPTIINEDEIAFIGQEDKYTNIYVFNRKTSNLEQLTNDRNFYAGLDHHKGKLVVSKEVDGIKHLFLLDKNSKELKPLTESNGNDVNPQFSPNGKWIAFESDRDGTDNIYLVRTETGEIRQVTYARVNADSPNWLKNHLLFNSRKLFSPEIYAIPQPGEITLRKEALEQRINQPIGKSFTLTENGIELVSEIKPTQEEKRGDLTSINGELAFEYDNQQQIISQVIPLEDRLILKALPNRNNIVRRESDFFQLKDGNINGLFEESPQLKKYLQENSKIDLALKDFRENHTVLSEILSSDKKYIAVVTNNNLSLEQNSSPTSLYVFDTESNRFVKQIPVETDPSDLNLGGIHFLGDDVLIVGNSEEGISSNLKIYNIKKNEQNSLFGGSLEDISVSENKRYIAAIKKGGIFRGGEINVEDTIVWYDRESKTSKEFSLNIQKGNADNLQFVGDSLFFTENSSGRNILHKFHPLKEKPENHETEYNSSIQERNILRAIAVDDKVALLLQSEDNEKEHLVLVTEDNVYNIKSANRFGNIFFSGDTLVYETIKRKGRQKVETFPKKEVIAVEKSRFQGDDLLISDGSTLYSYDLKSQAVSKVTGSIFGFDTTENGIIYSKPNGDSFVLESIVNGEKTVIGEGFLPLRIGEKVFFYKPGDNLSLNSFSSNSPKDTLKEEFNQGGFDVANLQESNGKVLFTLNPTGDKTIEDIISEQKKLNFKDKDISEAPWELKKLNGFLLVGWAPGFPVNLLINAQGILSDLPQNHVILANLITNTSTYALGSLSYLDLVNDWGANTYINKYDFLLTTGVGASKLMPINKFHRFGIGGGYEFQDWIQGENNHVLKSNGQYSLDTTQWDNHGPVKGGRVWMKIEPGYSMTDDRVNNVDFNLDARKYFYHARRVNSALRLSSGTSQGPVPTYFIMGGVDDVRGANLFSLFGQNYYYGAGEFRFPLAEIAGVILPEPIIMASVLTAGLDVRGKLFGYVSDTFLNKDIDKGLVDIPDFGTGLGIDFYYMGIRFTTAYTVYGKIDPYNGKSEPGWDKGWNMFILIPNW